MQYRNSRPAVYNPSNPFRRQEARIAEQQQYLPLDYRRQDFSYMRISRPTSLMLFVWPGHLYDTSPSFLRIWPGRDAHPYRRIVQRQCLLTQANGPRMGQLCGVKTSWISCVWQQSADGAQAHWHVIVTMPSDGYQGGNHLVKMGESRR